MSYSFYKRDYFAEKHGLKVSFVLCKKTYWK